MTTTFNSLVSDVATLTNRPDMVSSGEIALAVKAATLKAHQSDDYIFDLQETGLAFSTSDFYQTLDYKSVFPQWRKPRYLRKYDYSTPPGTPSDFLEIIQPEKVVDGYNADRLDIAYVAGSYLQIRTSAAFQYFLIGFYANPIVTSTGYNSWIANDFPFAITYEAAAIIFKQIGYDEQVATFRLMVAEQLQMLAMHAITPVGM